MSSKNVDQAASAPTTRRRTWSITGRLVLHFVGSTAALLLLATGFLYWKLKQSLDERDRALLASKVQVLRSLLREHPEDKHVLVNEIEHEASESALPYFLRILDRKQGGSILETPGMGEKLAPAIFPEPVRVQPVTPESIEPHLRRQGPHMLLSVFIPSGTDPGDHQILQVAFDTSQDQELLRNYLHSLVGILGIGLVFTAMAGALGAHLALKPLAKISSTASHISARQLHERLSASLWPSELAQLAAAFNAMLDRLEQSFARLSEFSSDLAHELRTPINNLRGEAEVTLHRSRSPEEYRLQLASSLEEFERLSRMIDGMLFIARADSPAKAVQRVRFDARKEVEAVCEFFEALAAEQEVTVELTGKAVISGDPLLFRRAVSNLLSNALKHTPSGGSIHLVLQRPTPESALLKVQDSGEGISPEFLPKVFQRFSRGDRNQSIRSGGIGLGLAIVQSIMRLHHGSVTVASERGKGTTFTLLFPGNP
jgi:two-component system heavy metal sensor histidine kinase CusS